MKQFGNLILIALGIGNGCLAWGSLGGETGNGLRSHYENKSANFEAYYPMGWSKLELAHAVSFLESEPGASQADRGAVSIAFTVLPAIRTVEELKNQLVQNSIGVQWQPVRVSGLRGYGNGNGMLYLIRNPGEVFAIAEKARADQKSQADVKIILDSLQFK